jgi:hypothetical protein
MRMTSIVLVVAVQVGQRCLRWPLKVEEGVAQDDRVAVTESAEDAEKAEGPQNREAEEDGLRYRWRQH